MIRHAYRLAAAGCAALVWRVPVLERPFVAVGARAWATPGIGRFYRSTAARLADRMRHGGSRFRSVAVQQSRLVLDVTEFTAGPLYFGGAAYEPRTAECFCQRLGPGSTFVDIGANHGYFSMLAASLVGPSGRVTAFEPNPAVFEQLRTHVALNGFEQRVTAWPWALADRPESGACLYLSQVDSNSGLSSLTPSADTMRAGGLSDTRTIPVPVETFDRWFAASGLDRIDLVKIDVEGAEARVVAGMSEALASRRIRAIVCETAWDSAAHRVLLAAGYAARPLDTAGTLTNVLYTGAS
jgi:FkbM family methyltransferase